MVLYSAVRSSFLSKTLPLNNAEKTLQRDNQNEGAKLAQYSWPTSTAKDNFINIILSKEKKYSDVLDAVDYFISFKQRTLFQAASCQNNHRIINKRRPWIA
jgi:hypothetical protein